MSAKMMHPANIFFTACFAFVSGYTKAETVRYRIDPVHTQVAFLAEHAGFSHSLGKFRQPEGELRFDAGAWGKSSVNVRLQSNNLDLSDSAWNKAMLGTSYFSAKAFPEIRFRSTVVNKLTEQTGTIGGELFLLGNVFTISFPFTLNKRGKHPYTLKDTIGFSARLTLSRSALGIKAAPNAIGDNVEIILEIEASKIVDTTPNTKGR
jgi:polyisoprenoid-binding protein YceI